jgi:broad specificity phosphatase PhoE
LQGSGVDLPLSPRGREQAVAVAHFLSTHPVRHVYASTLKRAVETAAAIASPHGLTVQSHEELSECHVGRWEGMDWDSIMREYPGPYRAFMDNPAENPYLEGESYGDVERRVRPVLRQLLEAHAGETIVVVGHNVVNRVYLSGLLGLALPRAKDIHQSNACVNVVRHRNGQTELLTLNAFFHLEERLR